jgi:hypothetical protein
LGPFDETSDLLFVITTSNILNRIPHMHPFIFLVPSVAHWAVAAPTEKDALQERQAINVNGCWCCGTVLQPNGNFYGAGTGCKAGKQLSSPFRISI